MLKLWAVMVLIFSLALVGASGGLGLPAPWNLLLVVLGIPAGIMAGVTVVLSIMYPGEDVWKR